MSASSDPSTDWMEEFCFTVENDYGEFVAYVYHNVHSGPPLFHSICSWKEEVSGKTQNKVAELTYQHLEDCGK